jgi:hypothetical protein
MIHIVSITIVVKDRGGYIIERGGIVSYIAGGPERAEMDIGTDKKNDPAGKRDEDKNDIRDLVVPGVSNSD